MRLSVRTWVKIGAPVAAVAALACAVAAWPESPHPGGRLFMARFTDGLELLQLVESADGHLSGTLTVISMDAAGHITTNPVPLAGARQGTSLSLEFKNGLFGLGNAHLIAVEDAFSVHLSVPTSNAGLEDAVYKRTSMTDFNRAQTELQNIATGRASTKEVERLTAVYGAIEREAKAVLAERAMLEKGRANVERRYDQVEDRMKTIAQRFDRSRDDLERGQLGVDLSQLGIDGDQIGYDVSSTVSSHLFRVKTLANRLEKFDDRCDLASLNLARGVTPERRNKWQTACASLADVMPEVKMAIGGSDNFATSLQTLDEDAQRRRKALLRG